MVLGSLALFIPLCPTLNIIKNTCGFGGWKEILGGIFEASQRSQSGHAAKPSLGLCGEAESYPWQLAHVQPSSQTMMCYVFAAWLSLLLSP